MVMGEENGEMMQELLGRQIWGDILIGNLIMINKSLPLGAAQQLELICFYCIIWILYIFRHA